MPEVAEVGCNMEFNESAASDRRGASRLALLIRSGKLITTRGEFLCVIRDLSQTGLSVRLFSPVPLDKHQTIEFQTGERHKIETVWHLEGSAGFRFTEAFDLAKGLAATSAFPKRALRLNLRRQVSLSTHADRTIATLHNLSNHGARIECSARRLAIGEQIQIETSQLLSARAKVCWRRVDTYGVVFMDIIPLSRFACLTAVLQLSDKATRPLSVTAA